MSRARRTLLALAGALILAGSTACIRDHGPGPEQTPTGGPGPSVTASLPPVGVDCRDLVTQGLLLRLQNAAQLKISAVEFGSGANGVVLVHQSDASMCQWLPYALVLAERGYRVLAFDFAGFGTSSPTQHPTYIDDIRTAVSYLRDQRGARHVVVIGASMGATMSVVASAAITPAVDGVIAVSPPRVFDGVNAEVAAPQLRTPALYIAGASDGDYEVYATDLSEETPAPFRELLVVQAPQHGVELVGAPTPAGAQVRAAIDAFLEARLAPPTATPATR